MVTRFAERLALRPRVVCDHLGESLAGRWIDDYDDLETVRFTRGFLEAPERYLRTVLEDD